MPRTIPTVDYRLALSNDDDERAMFVEQVGNSLKEIGFFALTNHGISRSLIDESYEQCDSFFDMTEKEKRIFLRPEIAHQRGYTAFGIEHAKDNPAPDLKEFWQSGRPYPENGDRPTYPENPIPPGHKYRSDDVRRKRQGPLEQERSVDGRVDEEEHAPDAY